MPFLFLETRLNDSHGMSFGHTGSDVVFEKVCLGPALFARVTYAEELGITFRDNLGYKAYMGDLP